MRFTVVAFVLLILWVAFIATMAVLLFRLLYRHLKDESRRGEQTTVRRSLGEALKDHRTRRGMTQEFVAESLGVSRQAVSKWENGTSDPSTANLLALAKLYGVDAGELLKNVGI